MKRLMCLVLMIMVLVLTVGSVLAQEAEKVEGSESRIVDVASFKSYMEAHGMPLHMFISELAKEYENKVKVCKVNIDEHQTAANHLGIQSIPTVMLFHKGQMVERLVGARPKETFSGILDKVLAAN